MLLEKKNILLAVTGGIAAYKMANVASMLTKLGAEVHVVMTENAAKFIPAETFQVLTKHKVYLDCFDEDPDDYVNVPHVSLGTGADCILVAPATADVIGKIANGIADDMVTTTILPARCPVLIAPSMNVYMLENPIVQDNLAKLKRFGYHIVEPATGHLACGYDGKGKLPDDDTLVGQVVLYASHTRDLEGKKILVNAGPTRESIDPVRYITNHSSGRMGYAIARMAAARGADVTLVSGPVELKVPQGVAMVPVTTAGEMYEEMLKRCDAADAIFMAAAVADFTPATAETQKIKKKSEGMNLSLVRTGDILETVGSRKRPDQFLCGFSMETENLLKNSRKKLEQKHADLICANDLNQPGAGYQTDTNILTLIGKHQTASLPLLSKDEDADRILDIALQFFQGTQY